MYPLEVHLHYINSTLVCEPSNVRLPLFLIHRTLVLPNVGICVKSFNSIFIDVPTIPYLNFKNGFRNNSKEASMRLLINNSVNYNCLLELNSILDIEPAHNFFRVYSKSLCVYGPTHLSQLNERSRYFASKSHINEPQFHIRIRGSIKDTLVPL